MKRLVSRVTLVMRWVGVVEVVWVEPVENS